MRRWWPAAAASVLVLATAATVVAIRLRGGSEPAASACVVADAAFLRTTDIGHFSVITDRRYTDPPGSLKGSGASGPSAFAADFVAARTRGFVNDLAIDGPDRAGEDAYARSLGYKVGRYPLVPLVGDVVLHNAGLLEVYQTNWSFTTTHAAGAWVDAIADSQALHADNESAPTRVSLAVGEQSIAFRHVAGPEDGRHEVVYLVAVRSGTSVVQLSIQGGAQLDAATASRIAAVALDGLRASCGDRS